MLFDDYLVEQLGGAIPEWFAVVLLVLGFLGSVYVVVPGAIAGAISDIRGRLTWLAIVFLTYATIVFIKPLLYISRPEAPPPIEADSLPFVLVPFHELGLSFTTGAFPSGHVTVATVFWGLVVIDTDILSMRTRAFGAATIVSLVSLSRVALSVHYLGDVLGGVVLGLVILQGTLLIRCRFNEPVWPLLAIAVVPSAGGIAAGRVLDGTILLSVILGLAVTHWWLKQTNVDLIQILKSRTSRRSGS